MGRDPPGRGDTPHTNAGERSAASVWAWGASTGARRCTRNRPGTTGCCARLVSLPMKTLLPTRLVRGVRLHRCWKGRRPAVGGVIRWGGKLRRPSHPGVRRWGAVSFGGGGVRSRWEIRPRFQGAGQTTRALLRERRSSRCNRRLSRCPTFLSLAARHGIGEAHTPRISRATAV